MFNKDGSSSYLKASDACCVFKYGPSIQLTIMTCYSLLGWMRSLSRQVFVEMEENILVDQDSTPTTTSTNQ